MYKTQKQKIKAALKTIKQCAGNCKQCEELKIKTANINARLTVYAFYCEVADRAGYNVLTQSIAEVKPKSIECLKFELS